MGLSQRVKIMEGKAIRSSFVTCTILTLSFLMFITHVHKITNVPYLFFYMALGLNDFDAGKSITRAIGRGWP